MSNKKETAKRIGITLCRKITVTTEDIDDIVATALEGGINYWCDDADVMESEYYGEFASDQISRGGSLRLHDSVSGNLYRLTLGRLINGIQNAYADGYGDGWFDGNKLDAYNIDSVAADIIIQYAIFGEIIYG